MKEIEMHWPERRENGDILSYESRETEMASLDCKGNETSSPESWGIWTDCPEIRVLYMAFVNISISLSSNVEHGLLYDCGRD